MLSACLEVPALAKIDGLLDVRFVSGGFGSVVVFDVTGSKQAAREACACLMDGGIPATLAGFQIALNGTCATECESGYRLTAVALPLKWK